MNTIHTVVKVSSFPLLIKVKTMMSHLDGARFLWRWLSVLRFFGGLVLDIKRKAPFYLSDFKDGLSLQCVASFLFLYCACMSPVITFGGLLGEATEGRIVRRRDSFTTCNLKESRQTTLFAFAPLVSERHRVVTWCVYDWSGLLAVCWSASHHSGQHRSCSGLWENSLQILQVSTINKIASCSPIHHWTATSLSSQRLQPVLPVSEDLYRPLDGPAVFGVSRHRRQFSGLLHHSLYGGGLRRPHLPHFHLRGPGEAIPPGRIVPLSHKQRPGQTHTGLVSNTNVIFIFIWIFPLTVRMFCFCHGIH